MNPPEEIVQVQPSAAPKALPENSIESSDLSQKQTQQRLSKLNIFISYQVKNDNFLAKALKKLIEDSIDPKPFVFVSGDGGLIASKDSLKKQIQHAVNNSNVVIGLLTKNSKGREWVHYEAGAAWALDAIYAPVLVGIEPSEMPNPINDYYAVSGKNKDEMQSMLASFAQKSGSDMKQRFGIRFTAFDRQVDNYLTGSLTDLNSLNEDYEDDIDHAIKLIKDGDVESAEQLFSKYESDYSDSVDKICRMYIIKHQALYKSKSTDNILHELRERFGDTCYYNYASYLYNDHPGQEEIYLRKAVEKPVGNAGRLAQVALAKHLQQTGKPEESRELSVKIIHDAPYSNFSEQAAICLTNLSPNVPPIDKLLLYLIGLNVNKMDGYQFLISLSESNDWHAFRLYLCERVNGFSATGHTLNNVGRAYHSLKMYNLAYQAYTKSYDLNYPVAKCNMASLLCHTKNEAAAKVCFDDHQGVYDCDDMSFPFSVKRAIEKAIHEESENASSLLQSSKSIFNAILVITEILFRNRNDYSTTINGRLASAHNEINLINGVPTAEPEDESFKKLTNFENGYYRDSGDLGGVDIVIVAKNEVRAINVDSFVSMKELIWYTWIPSPLFENSAIACLPNT